MEKHLITRVVWRITLVLLMAALGGVAGSRLAGAVENSPAYTWDLPTGFPNPAVPANNPMSAAKVELGRYLFYDKRLSGNGTQSCSTCHMQALAFTDGRARPVGSSGQMHPRNAQTLTNAAYNSTYTWANPLLTELERQIPIPMFGETPVELGITGKEQQVLARFKRDKEYQKLFAAAYPADKDPFTWQRITQALASFTRTLISGDSPYDRYKAGDKTAISESAKRGQQLFFSERLECHHCHTGFNMSAATYWQGASFAERAFFNTGLYNLDGEGAYPSDNTGVHEITTKATDMGKFRPPTLRNIALTAPYMHDGSVATLEEVIRIYERGGRLIETGELAGDGRKNPYKSGFLAGVKLSDTERSDLIAFLESLTDETFITDPRFGDPFVAANTPTAK